MSIFNCTLILLAYYGLMGNALYTKEVIEDKVGEHRQVTGTEIGTKNAADVNVIGPVGQELMVDSIPVVISSDQSALTVNPTGLQVGGKITEVTLNSTTWTALPLTALVNRNTLSIQNNSGIEIKLNYDNAVSTYTGVVIADGNERSYDIKDSILIYAKSQSGTPVILTEEIA